MLQLQRWGVVLCAPPIPDLNLVYCSRTSDYQSTFQFCKKGNTMNNVLSQSFHFWDSFFLVWFRNIGILCLTMLPRCYSFYKLMVCGNPKSRKSMEFSNCMCLFLHVSVSPLGTSQHYFIFTTFHYHICYGDLWSLICDVISLSSWRPQWWLAGFWQWNLFKLRQT